MKNIFVLTVCFLLLSFSFSAHHSLSQEKVVIDQVVGVVGNSAILESDIINQKRQMEAQGVDLGPNPVCALFDEMLYQKLLYNQAMIDSVEVDDEQVEQVLERRLRYFIQQIGSREQLEAYYGKTIDELKDEFREIVREQEVSQRMENKITQNITVTPSEVRRFYNNMPQEDIPIVESEMQLAKIQIAPPIREDEIAETKRRLEEFRQRILAGESFSTLAILYSDDPGSARRGGELGFFGRGELFPEFEATAFGLRPGEVSEIVETEAGYHIIQLIERRGEQFNVRHILLQPQVSPEDIARTRNQLDSIRTLIQTGEMAFEEAALEFSDHPSRVNEGLMVNPFTNTTRFTSEHLEPNLFFVIDRMEVGQISEPIATRTEDGQPAFKLVKLTQRTQPHRANLEEDYDFIQKLARQEKQKRVIRNWINQRLAATYTFIHENYRDCNFDHDWLKEEVSKR